MALEMRHGALMVAENTFIYEGVTFKAYQEPEVGDFICRLTVEDTYHVSRAVFVERNIVEIVGKSNA